MRTWVALIRGINVGGNHTLPMAKLVRDLESINLKRVHTYIQSGNVVFQSTIDSGSQLTAKLSANQRTEIICGEIRFDK